jgi:fibronectin-binding autotransporter adhesin
MTLKTLDYETGPEGAALTTTNSGLSQVTPNGTGTAVFSKTVVRSGTLGAKFNSSANALCIGRATTIGTSNTISENVVWSLASTPNVILGIWSVRGTGVAGRINWNTDNSLSFVDAALGNVQVIATGLTPGTIYELSIRAKSATTTTGTFTAVLYNTAGTELGRASSTSYNLGTAPLTACDIGVLNTNAAANSLSIDYLQIDDGNANELRAPSAGTNYQGNLALTGAGTLGQTATAAATGTLPLTGTGTVTQAGTAAGTSAVALTGSGALTQAATNAGTSELPLTGAGVLTETATVAGSSSAPTTGSGTLAIAATTNQTASLNLTATGSLDMATSAQRTAAVALAGSGTFTAATSGGAQTARLDLTSLGSIDLSSTVVHAGNLGLTGTGQITLTIDGTDHHDLLELAGIGSLVFIELGKQRDITVTVVALPRAWTAAPTPRKYTATQQPRRWDAHANVPAGNH